MWAHRFPQRHFRRTNQISFSFFRNGVNNVSALIVLVVYELNLKVLPVWRDAPPDLNGLAVPIHPSISVWASFSGVYLYILRGMRDIAPHISSVVTSSDTLSRNHLV